PGSIFNKMLRIVQICPERSRGAVVVRPRSRHRSPIQAWTIFREQRRDIFSERRRGGRRRGGGGVGAGGSTGHACTQAGGAGGSKRGALLRRAAGWSDTGVR